MNIFYLGARTALLSASVLLLALSGCAAAPTPSAEPSDPPGVSNAPLPSNLTSAYEGPWSTEEILDFPSEQRVLGVITEIGTEQRAEIAGASPLTWHPITIRVSSASPVLDPGHSFIARVIPAFDGQPDLTKLRVGQRVIYLGARATEDPAVPGTAAGTSSWILTVSETGEVDVANQRGDEMDADLTHVATKLGLTIPERWRTAP